MGGGGGWGRGATACSIVDAGTFKLIVSIIMVSKLVSSPRNFASYSPGGCAISVLSLAVGWKGGQVLAEIQAKFTKIHVACT